MEVGTRQTFTSGMMRSTGDGKIMWSLTRDGPMFKRWAIHLTTGATLFGKRNWLLANSRDELERARESAARHFEQWFNGELDEDHAAAVFFNINVVEYVKEFLSRRTDGS